MIRRVLPLVLLVVATNVMMLASMRANRLGEPDASMVLTERELRLEASSDRDSSQRLQFEMPDAFLQQSPTAEPTWLTVEKLSALGVRCPPPSREESFGGPCGLPRRVFVVYEYDGPAWQREAANLRRRRDEAPQSAIPSDQYLRSAAIDAYDRWTKRGSRLMPIDAATDPGALRRAHPDGRRYLVVPGVAQAWVAGHRRDSPPAPRVTGTIAPDMATLIAPVHFRDLLVPFGTTDRTSKEEPRYAVRIAFGAHLEPWILGIDPIDRAVAPH